MADDGSSEFQRDSPGPEPTSWIEGARTESSSEPGPVTGSAPVVGQRGGELFIPFGAAIGSGGQGTVFKAVQTSLRRVVALKRPIGNRAGATATPTEDQSQSLGFLREALTTALLDHPNIVQIYDIGEDSHGNPFLAMKLVKGRVWSDVISTDRGLPVDEFLAIHIPILVSVAQAIAFAHSRGILHRDLNPNQVMVGEFGEVYVMDWGLAVAWDTNLLAPTRQEVAEVLGITPEVIAEYGAPPLARASAPAGTRAWMAPEQSLDQPNDLGPWTDVYLLGGILFNLLTSTVPHERSGERGRVISPVEPPSKRAPGRFVPEELEALCVEAMQHDRNDRLADVQLLVRDLQGYLLGSHRNREADRIMAAMATQFDDNEPIASTFSDLADMERELSRAIELNPSHAMAMERRSRVQARQVEIALEHGDLMVAKTTVARLNHGDPHKQPLADRIAKALVARDRQKRRQKVATITLLCLLVATSGLAMLVAVINQREAEARESASLAAKEQASAEETAKLLARINTVRSEESDLSRIFATEFPLPEFDDEESLSPGTSSTDHEALLTKRAQLSHDRSELIAEYSEASELLGSEPFSLMLGEANRQLRDAHELSEVLAAYKAYQEAGTQQGEERSPEVETGLGIAASRAGFGTSSTIHLSYAAEAIAERLGTGHPDYRKAIERLSQAYRRNEELPQSYETYYKKSLKIQEEQWTSTTMGLIESWMVLENGEFSLQYAQLLAKVAERQYGGESIEEARALVLLGRAARLRDQRKTAEESYRRAIELFKHFQGDSSSEAADATLDLATFLVSLKRGADAIMLAQEAEATISASQAPLRTRLRAKLRLAQVLMQDSRWDDSIAIMREILATQTVTLGPDHPDTLKTIASLASAINGKGSGDDRVEIYAMTEHVISKMKKRMGARHPATLDAMGTRAKLLEFDGHSDMAVQLLQFEREAYLEALPPGHSKILSCDSQIASALMSDKKPWEALPYIMEIREKTRQDPDDHRVYLKYLVLLGRFSQDIGNPLEGLNCQARIVQAMRSYGESYRYDMRIALFGLQLMAGNFPPADRLIISRYFLFLEAAEPTSNLINLQHVMTAFLDVSLSMEEDRERHLLESAIILRNLEKVLREDSAEYSGGINMTRASALATGLMRFMDQLKELHPECAQDLRPLARWTLALRQIAAVIDDNSIAEGEGCGYLDGIEQKVAEFGVSGQAAEEQTMLMFFPLFPVNPSTPAELLAVVDRFAAPIDWDHLLPEIDDWTIEGLYPGMQATEDELGFILDRVTSKPEPELPPLPPGVVDLRSGEKH